MDQILSELHSWCLQQLSLSSADAANALEVVSGDASFRRKSRAVFADRMRQSGAIMVNHAMPELRQYCDSGLVLENGKVHYFEDLEEAIALHQDLMR